MNNLSIPTKQELEDRYLKQSMSMQKIASEFKMSVGKIHKLIHFYEIPTRDQKESFTMKGRKLTQEQRERISKIHKGKQLSEETKQKISQSHIKGGIGHKKQGKDGYISVYFPDHPKSSKIGYIMEHILVMEALIGRHLKDDECVHHIDRNKKNNRKENLSLMTKSEHMSLHSKERWEEYRNAQ